MRTKRLSFVMRISGQPNKLIPYLQVHDHAGPWTYVVQHPTVHWATPQVTRQVKNVVHCSATQQAADLPLNWHFVGLPK